MEYLNDRFVLLAQVAHTRGLIEKVERDAVSPAYLLALLDQQEAALHEYDERIKANQNQHSD